MGGGAPYPPVRALRPCGHLVAPPTSSPSRVVVFWSMKNHCEGFTPFGISFLQNSKIGKKIETGSGPRLIG